MNTLQYSTKGLHIAQPPDLRAFNRSMEFACHNGVSEDPGNIGKETEAL